MDDVVRVPPERLATEGFAALDAFGSLVHGEVAEFAGRVEPLPFSGFAGVDETNGSFSMQKEKASTSRTS